MGEHVGELHYWEGEPGVDDLERIKWGYALENMKRHHEQHGFITLCFRLPREVGEIVTPSDPGLDELRVEVIGPGSMEELEAQNGLPILDVFRVGHTFYRVRILD